MGLTVNKNNDVLTVSKDNIEVECKIISKEVVINVTTKILSTKSQDIDGIVFGEMNLMAKEFGYNLKCDSFADKIEFTK